MQGGDVAELVRTDPAGGQQRSLAPHLVPQDHRGQLRKPLAGGGHDEHRRTALTHHRHRALHERRGARRAVDGHGGFVRHDLHEGIIFVEQAESFGSVSGVLDRWLQRARWPSASFANGLPVTTNAPGEHLPAFVSLYSSLVQTLFRENPSWDAHIGNLLASHGAWTDDAGARHMTVFSAGTTAPQWGGYHADSLSDHPGDVTTFPSLMAFSGDGRTAPAVGAYEAYRRGARQRFESGASILYRRSDEIPSYVFNSAGLPDVALGALGLAELIEAGSVGAVLAGGYDEPGCAVDLARPFGVLDLADINAFVSGFVAQLPDGDLNGDGLWDLSDIALFVDFYLAGCGF